MADARPADLKVRLVLRRAADVATYRQDVDLRSLSPAALRLLARMEPRLQERSFYDLPIEQRVVDLQPRTMLAAVGSPDRALQPHPEHLLLPEIQCTDRRFQLSAYGHPRNTETYVKWLDGCARTIESARASRQMKLDAVNTMLDQRIDGWLRSLPAKDPSSLVVPHDDLGWRFDWQKVRLSPHHSEDLALKHRLRDRVQASRSRTLREYIMSIPELERFAKAADAVVAPSPAPAP